MTFKDLYTGTEYASYIEVIHSNEGENSLASMRMIN